MGIFEEKIKPDLGKGFGQINPQTLVECAEQIGQNLSSDKADGLKNHQLRKFYDAVKQIERHTLSLKPDEQLPNERIAQLLFLRPHLANAERKGHGIRPLRNVLDPCLSSDVIKRKADLTQFVKFFEAIVAYAN